MNLILYIVAFFEGFTTLSVEIMSIRNSIAIVGSNSISTSIILGIILLALSYGYYRGGVFASKNNPEIIKRKIYINLLIASIFYTFVSFPFENLFLSYLLSLNIGYFLPIFIGVSVLFILPVFLASQTIPLLSELIDDDKKAVIIGKLLFFSTVGSFLGSVVTSLIFFSYIGVEKAIVVNGIILAILALVTYLQFDKKAISAKWIFFNFLYIGILLGLFFFDFSRFWPKNTVYSYSSEYNDITVLDDNTTRLFMMNGSHSSGIDVATGKSYFGYIQKITDIIDQEKPKKILIIGAAGFSLPQDIAKRDYVEKVDVCDIDGSLDVIAEKYFLHEKLHPKIIFYKESARYFVNEKIRNNEKYDFIFIDAYNGKISIPSELLTKDFFDSIKKISSGSVSMNVILDVARESMFFKKLSNTLLSSFGKFYHKGVSGIGISFYDNFIYINHPSQNYIELNTYPYIWLYSDNQNTLEIDKYNLFYTQHLN